MHRTLCMRVCAQKMEDVQIVSGCLKRGGPSSTWLYHLSFTLHISYPISRQASPTFPCYFSFSKQHVLTPLLRQNTLALLSPRSSFLDREYNTTNSIWVPYISAFTFPRDILWQQVCCCSCGLHFQEESREASRQNRGEASQSSCHQLG